MITPKCPNCGAKQFGLVSQCYKCKQVIDLRESEIQNQTRIEGKNRVDADEVVIGTFYKAGIAWYVVSGVLRMLWSYANPNRKGIRPNRGEW